MAMFIVADKCIACGACWAECAVQAIKEEKKYMIIEEKCLDCGACRYVCPNDAIFYDQEAAKKFLKEELIQAKGIKSKH